MGRTLFKDNVKNEVFENVQPVSRTNKPDSVFVQEDVNSIGDFVEDITNESNWFSDNLFNIETVDSSTPEKLDDSYLTDDFFKNDENKIDSMSFEIIPSNFRIDNGRILGTVNIKSVEKSYTKYRLHVFFSPLDLPKDVFGQKINDIYFKEDFSETIEINESAKNYKNLTIRIHVMTDNGKVVGQEKILDVLENDSTDMPVKPKDDNTTKYIIAGVGILGLLLIVRRLRKKWHG